MLRRLQGAVLVFVLSGNPVAAADGVKIDPSRGELLYSTHCIKCHTEQAHWRDRKLATDWPTLLAEVQRWQVLGGLGWSAEDVAEVGRHLNAVHYHYPHPDR